MREVGTWLLTCTCICAWVGLGVSVPGDRGGPGTFTCHTNNILRIDCHWSAPELGQGAGPWLLFTSNHAPGSKHRCVFWASVCTVELPPEEVLVPSDNFTITFHRHVSGKEQVSLVDPQYLPRRHVKLDPPSDLLSNITSNHCVLTWSINPALEPLASLLSYELAFKRQEETWERAWHKDHIVGVTWLKLEATELDPGSTYEARLRVQMATPEDAVAEEERYEGPWSDWSQPTRFHSPQRQGLLVPALGQRDSTLVSVSIFLLLTSLTYLLFKLSPRSVAKECVWECVHVSECVIVHVGVRIRMCMSVCVRLWVWGRRCIEGPNPHPLPQRSWVGRGFQASDPDQWGCPQLPGACGWWAVWPKRALEGPKVPGAESPEALVSCLWRCLALAHLHSGFMQTVLGIWFSRGPVSCPDGCHGQPDEQKSPPETSHHTWGLVPQETGQAWTGSREDERRLDRGSQGEGGTGCWARWVAKRTREGSGLPSGPRRAPEAWSRGMGSGLCFENGVLWYK
ncbi:interleukin-9 receptor isoform X1 [Pseudorca crassidens]|uniref:interleukin-9 receptor isoform X1 n=1 Tax=Pseudorca crassidens TaxID=82174 RepID=UPI00352F5895